MALLPVLPASHQRQRVRPGCLDPAVTTGGRGAARAKPKDIARIVGGHGTFGARPFSPDGQRFAYASFEPPAPTIRIILFTASDRTPPAGAVHRLTQIADATEKFLFGEMKRWKYPPAVTPISPRIA